MVLDNLLDVSVIIAVFGAMILYFGKLMSDIDVESHDKLDYSVMGAIFTFVWIIIPVVLVYGFYINIFTSIQSSFFWDSIFYLLPLLFMIIILAIIRESIKLRKCGKNIKNSDKFFIKIMRNSYILWLFSFFSIISTFYWYSFIGTELMNFTILIVDTFFILSMVAMIEAFKKNEYPIVRFFLQNNPTPVQGTSRPAPSLGCS